MSFGADYVTKKRSSQVGDIESGKMSPEAEAFSTFLGVTDALDVSVKKVHAIAEEITKQSRAFKQVGSIDKKQRKDDYERLREKGDREVLLVRKHQQTLKKMQSKAGIQEAAQMRPLVVSKTKSVIKALDGLSRANKLVKDAQELETNRMMAIIMPDVTITPEMREDSQENGWEQVMQLNQKSKRTVASHEMTQGLDEAQERLKMAKQIAKSMQEIKVMVQDMAELVNEQTEQLNLIEENISMAKDNLQQGNEHLDVAIKTQIENRKKMVKLVIIGTLIMIVLVLALLGFFSWLFCGQLNVCGN